MRSHEPEDPFRSVSRANQAVALARISRSSRSLRTSRRSRRNSSRSAVVVPSLRRPSSRSACLTQLRIDCAEGSNSRARWSGLRPDRTRSTICCRYSAGYGGLDLGVVGTSSYKEEVSTKPGQAHGSPPPAASRKYWLLSGTQANNGSTIRSESTTVLRAVGRVAPRLRTPAPRSVGSSARKPVALNCESAVSVETRTAAKHSRWRRRPLAAAPSAYPNSSAALTA